MILSVAEDHLASPALKFISTVSGSSREFSTRKILVVNDGVRKKREDHRHFSGGPLGTSRSA
jgi:hypothetical protein